jgi:hypothetical protein
MAKTDQPTPLVVCVAGKSTLHLKRSLLDAVIDEVESQP